MCIHPTVNLEKAGNSGARAKPRLIHTLVGKLSSANVQRIIHSSMLRIPVTLFSRYANAKADKTVQQVPLACCGLLAPDRYRLVGHGGRRYSRGQGWCARSRHRGR